MSVITIFDASALISAARFEIAGTPNIILNRFEMHPRFLPDVMVWLAQQGDWSENLARQALAAVQARYRSGFITHSLEQLKGSV